MVISHGIHSTAYHITVSDSMLSGKRLEFSSEIEHLASSVTEFNGTISHIRMFSLEKTYF